MFITSSISASTGPAWSLWRPVWMWCNAALSKTVRMSYLFNRCSIVVLVGYIRSVLVFKTQQSTDE